MKVTTNKNPNFISVLKTALYLNLTIISLSLHVAYLLHKTMVGRPLWTQIDFPLDKG